MKVRGHKRYFIQTEMRRKWELHYSYQTKDFKTKATEEYKGHYMTIKGSIQKEDFTLVNIYAPNT